MKKGRWNKWIVFLLAGSVAMLFWHPKSESEQYPEANLSSVQQTVEISDQANQPETVSPPVGNKNIEIKAENKIIQTKKTLPVAFLSQAPFQIWDVLHEDACEEASLLMVFHYFQGDASISPTTGDQEIKKMISYEEKNGYGISINLDELNAIARDYLGLKNGQVKKNIKMDDIKEEIDQNHSVIIPAAGKVLPNPNFRNGGPNYHMLVVIGYDEKGFVTNDPGTHKGKDFYYTYSGLFNAIHDWDPKNILNGGKAYLVFE
jgi:uncharacterized protein YvpB